MFKRRLLKVSALIVGITLILCFAACSNGSTGGDNNNNQTPSTSAGAASLGETLKLSGQVYLEEDVYADDSYTRYTGNLTVISDGGGSGAITNGRLDFTIGKPNQLEYLDLNEIFGDLEWINLQATKNSVKYFLLDALYIDDSIYGYECWLEKSTTSYTGNGWIYESVVYMYVEEDVNITGKGTTVNYTDDYVSEKEITNDLSLALKKGWNALYGKEVMSYDNPNYQTDTYTISLSNPTLRWVLVNYDGD